MMNLPSCSSWKSKKILFNISAERTTSDSGGECNFLREQLGFVNLPWGREVLVNREGKSSL